MYIREVDSGADPVAQRRPVLLRGAGEPGDLARTIDEESAFSLELGHLPAPPRRRSSSRCLMTASGRRSGRLLRVRHHQERVVGGIIAVDPQVMPLGSIVEILATPIPASTPPWTPARKSRAARWTSTCPPARGHPRPPRRPPEIDPPRLGPGRPFRGPPDVRRKRPMKSSGSPARRDGPRLRRPIPQSRPQPLREVNPS